MQGAELASNYMSMPLAIRVREDMKFGYRGEN